MAATHLKPDDKRAQTGRGPVDDWHLQAYVVGEGPRTYDFREFVDWMPNAKHFCIAVSVGLSIDFDLAAFHIPRQTNPRKPIQTKAKMLTAPAALPPATPPASSAKVTVPGARTAAPSVQGSLPVIPAANRVSPSELEHSKAPVSIDLFGQ